MEAAKDRPPEGFLFIDEAVARLRECLSCPEAVAGRRLVSAMAQGEMRVFRRSPDGRILLPEGSWMGAAIDLEGFRASCVLANGGREGGFGGVIYQSRPYHLHSFLIPVDEFEHWMGDVSGSREQKIIEPATKARSHNGKDYRASDAALFPAMIAARKSGDAISVEGAAWTVLERALPLGRSTQPNSKVKRLARGFRLAHPEWSGSIPDHG